MMNATKLPLLFGVRYLVFGYVWKSAKTAKLIRLIRNLIKLIEQMEQIQCKNGQSIAYYGEFMMTQSNKI